MTVELTLADTNYRLLDLVRAIDPAFVDSPGIVTLQVAIAPGGTVLFGDSTLSATNAEHEIVSGGGVMLNHSTLGKLYARGVAVAAMLVHIGVKR